MSGIIGRTRVVIHKPKSSQNVNRSSPPAQKPFQTGPVKSPAAILQQTGRKSPVFSYDAVMQLQRTLGNRAVTQLLRSGFIMPVQRRREHVDGPPPEMTLLERRFNPADRNETNTPATPSSEPEENKTAVSNSIENPVIPQTKPKAVTKTDTEDRSMTDKEKDSPVSDFGTAPKEEVTSAPAAPPPGTQKKAENKEKVAKPMGIAGTADTFFNSTASEIAGSMGRLGDNMTAAFVLDRKKIRENTPPMTSAVGTEGIPAPQRTPLPSPMPVPAATPYRPPVSRSNRNDVPRFRPVGAANPKQIHNDAVRNNAAVRTQHRNTERQLTETFGEERIQPINSSASKEIETSAPSRKIKTATSPEMAEYLAMDLPGNVRRNVDQTVNLKEKLAGPKHTIHQALQDRDQKHQKAVENTKKQAEKLQVSENEKQKQVIENARASISEEKNNTLNQSRDLLKQYEGRVSEEKKGTLELANREIGKTEEKITETMDRARREADKKQQEADNKVKREKEKAEDKKRSRPWYKKIGDFFAAVGRALVNTVKGIISAVKKVIKGILEAARKLAHTFIDACAAVVTGLIKKFGQVLKILTGTILAAFPALRNRLNAFIDKVVTKSTAAVNRIAKGLKEAVNRLVASLNKLVDVIAAAAEAIVSGGITMIGALLKGDFKEMLKIAFEAGCKIVGVSPESMWAILKNAGAVIWSIVKKPGKFFGNLIKAVMNGFGLFVSNIWEYLKKGLMDWLVGQAAVAGVEVPAKFTAAAVFNLLRALMGINLAFVRQRAIKLLGRGDPEKEARIEKVLGYIEMIFTSGPTAIWEMVGKFASGLKEKLFGKILNWAVVQVAKKALLKIASMFIPGMGFVQAILGIWSFIQWFIEKGRHIWTMVTSIFKSIREIAEGKVGKAAKFICKTLAAMIPLVFSFLAKLLRINVAKGIQRIIRVMKKPVIFVIDKSIRFVWRMGKGLMKLVRRGLGAVKRKFGRSKKLKDPKAEKLRQTRAVQEVLRAVNNLKGKRKRFLGKEREAVSRAQVTNLLAKKKKKHGFSSLRLLTPAGKQIITFHAGFSPGNKFTTAQRILNEGNGDQNIGIYVKNVVGNLKNIVTAGHDKITGWKTALTDGIKERTTLNGLQETADTFVFYSTADTWKRDLSRSKQKRNPPEREENVMAVVVSDADVTQKGKQNREMFISYNNTTTKDEMLESKLLDWLKKGGVRPKSNWKITLKDNSGTDCKGKGLHAEMNLIEKVGGSLKPGSYIFISKKACLACGASILIDGRFRITKAPFQKAWNSWQLPNFIKNNDAKLNQFLGPTTYQVYLEFKNNKQNAPKITKGKGGKGQAYIANAEEFLTAVTSNWE
jgi:hypothetical protein